MTLTKDETEMIEREAAELYNRFNDAVSERYRIGYIHAATKYLLQLKEERERAGKLMEALEAILKDPYACWQEPLLTNTINKP